jgi:hypothetical protein
MNMPLPLGLALLRRAATKLVVMACITFVAGCASIYQAYDGPEQPASEVATVSRVSPYAFVWSYIAIYAVDGHPLSNGLWNGVSVLPGTHRYQVFDTRRSKLAAALGQDAFYEEATCGFMLDAAPGTTYTLVSVDSDGQVSTSERKVYRASLEIEERFACGDPVTRHIPIECASMDLIKHGWFERLEPIFLKGFLCQEQSECLAEGEACIPVSRSVVTRMVFAGSLNQSLKAFCCSLLVTPSRRKPIKEGKRCQEQFRLVRAWHGYV